jgi:hypothetical protein
MRHQWVLGMAMTVCCLHVAAAPADGRAEGGLEGVLDRLEQRAMTPEPAPPPSPRTARVRPPERLPAPAQPAVMRQHTVMSAPALEPVVAEPEQSAPAGPSRVWGAREQPVRIPELDE